VHDGRTLGSDAPAISVLILNNSLSLQYAIRIIMNPIDQKKAGSSSTVRGEKVDSPVVTDDDTQGEQGLKDLHLHDDATDKQSKTKAEKANIDPKELGPASLLREPDAVGIASRTATNTVTHAEGTRKKNEEAQKVKRDYSGIKARPGAYAVRGAEDTATYLPPQRGSDGDATPAVDSDFLASKIAIANRGGTLRGASHAPDVASVEEIPIASEKASPSILSSKAAIANRRRVIQTVDREVAEAPTMVSRESVAIGEIFGTESKKSEKPQWQDTVPKPSDQSDGFLAQDESLANIAAAESVLDEPRDDIERQDIIRQVQLVAEADLHQQMMPTVVAADGVDKLELEDTPGKKRWYIIIVMLALIIIVAAVGRGVVGGRSSPAPPVPVAAFPSQAPTKTPNSDFCEGALDVTTGIALFSVNLQNTAIETRLSCSSGVEIEQRGRWYEYSGNGLSLKVELFSAAADKTEFEILTGASCGEVACVDTDIVRGDTVRSSTASFITEENTTYYIHVFSTLDATSEPEEAYNLRVSDNSACLNAYAIALVNSQTLLLGSTVAAGVRDLAPRCGTASSVPGGAGVWYTVLGSGLRFEAFTCTGASFDTQISVFSGDCGSLECITGNNDSCGTQSSVLWLTGVSCRVASVRSYFLPCASLHIVLTLYTSFFLSIGLGRSKVLHLRPRGLC
jgi:hypothetical protein